jgi:hypothetical protein
MGPNIRGYYPPILRTCSKGQPIWAPFGGGERPPLRPPLAELLTAHARCTGPPMEFR